MRDLTTPTGTQGGSPFPPCQAQELITASASRNKPPEERTPGGGSALLPGDQQRRCLLVKDPIYSRGLTRLTDRPLPACLPDPISQPFSLRLNHTLCFRFFQLPSLLPLWGPSYLFQRLPECFPHMSPSGWVLPFVHISQPQCPCLSEAFPDRPPHCPAPSFAFSIAFYHYLLVSYSSVWYCLSPPTGMHST